MLTAILIFFTAMLMTVAAIIIIRTKLLHGRDTARVES